MREYYVSKELIEDLVNSYSYSYSSVDCYVQTKDNCQVTELASVVEQTDSERGRHDLAILYKTARLINHAFQLSFDLADYGAGGYDYGEETLLTQADRKKVLKNEAVLIYGLSEGVDNNTVFFKVDVLAEDTGVMSEIDKVTAKVDIEAVLRGLKDGTSVILPVRKDNGAYERVIWSKDTRSTFKFHEEYMPKVYTEVALILSDKVTVPKDFVLFDFYIMDKTVETDAQGNRWVSLSYDCCLNTLDLMELDSSGKTHMYILGNFKDIAKQEIYESFLNLPKTEVLLETMLRVVETVKPESTKWLEDFIIETIMSKESYHFSNYIDIIVKYVRVTKKSKDRNVERLIDLMLGYSGYVHIDGYVRIIKALKLESTELTPYLERVIEVDKLTKQAGGYVSSFIREWKTESFKVLEDYLYEGIQTQVICEPFKNCNNKTDEERQRRGLNTDYDFVKSYLSLLSIKGVDKISLVVRFLEGVKEDATHFPVATLLRQVDYAIRYDKASVLVPLLVQCLIDYDKYGEFAEKYLPEEKLKELGLYSWGTSYSNADFEPYIEVLAKLVVEGKKKKSEDEWAKRLEKQQAEFAARLKK